MAKKTQTRQQGQQPRVRGHNERLDPVDALNDFLGTLVGVFHADRDMLANRMVAYHLATAANHPYANMILEDTIRLYASRGGIELPKDVKYDSLNHDRVTDMYRGLGGMLREKSEPIAPSESMASYGRGPDNRGDNGYGRQ